VRLAFSITVCGLVPATNVNWLADRQPTGRFTPNWDLSVGARPQMAPYGRTPPTSLGAQTRTRPVSCRLASPRLGQVALLQLDCGGRLYAVQARQPLALPLRAVAGAARPQRRRQDLEILVKVTVPTQRRHHHRHRGLPTRGAPVPRPRSGHRGGRGGAGVCADCSESRRRPDGSRPRAPGPLRGLRRRASPPLVAGLW
jgi:hypothetical protein